MPGLSRFWAGLVARANAHRLVVSTVILTRPTTKCLKFQIIILDLFSEPNIWEIDNFEAF